MATDFRCDPGNEYADQIEKAVTNAWFLVTFRAVSAACRAFVIASSTRF